MAPSPWSWQLKSCACLKRHASLLRAPRLDLPVAGGVLQDFMKRSRGAVDPGIWNAFITAAGRANQLQRALQALKDMQVWLSCAHAPRLGCF